MFMFSATVICLCFQQLCTALHEAARRGHADIARMLLEKNADVNAEAKVMWALHVLIVCSDAFDSRI